MTAAERKRTPSAAARLAWTLVLAGAGFVALYYLLRAFQIGGIGAPSDIGGGLIVLSGYLLVAAGLLLALVRALTRRAGSRSQ